MYKIKIMNNICETGLSLFPSDKYEISENVENPDAILVRSANLNDVEIPASVKAIARAGAGYNNIPVAKCSEKGIVVFNTPGGNANSVKELVLASLFLSSRKIYQGICWTQSLTNNGKEVEKQVEKGKSQFQGPEIRGKRLGIIGLGAIGSWVANDALALGMEVIGFDPFISVSAAWRLSRNVIRATSLEHLISTSDYITLHVPQDTTTKGMINKETFDLMKDGVRIINLARGGLVNNDDMLEALNSGKVSSYVTDFPDKKLLGHENLITIPHLGASTPESEDNCAIMAVQQTMDFLETGAIKNSVNYPACELHDSVKKRIINSHDNVPNMVGQITTVLANNKINIADMVTRHRDSIGYNIIEVEGDLTEEVADQIRAIKGIRMVRIV